MKLDNSTLELPGLGEPPRKRGRPFTGQARSAKQRMSEYRQRLKEQARAAKRAERRRSDLELARALALRIECDDLEGAKSAWLDLARRFSWHL